MLAVELCISWDSFTLLERTSYTPRLSSLLNNRLAQVKAYSVWCHTWHSLHVDQSNGGQSVTQDSAVVNQDCVRECNIDWKIHAQMFWWKFIYIRTIKVQCEQIHIIYSEITWEMTHSKMADWLFVRCYFTVYPVDINCTAVYLFG